MKIICYLFGHKFTQLNAEDITYCLRCKNKFEIHFHYWGRMVTGFSVKKL